MFSFVTGARGCDPQPVGFASDVLRLTEPRSAISLQQYAKVGLTPLRFGCWSFSSGRMTLF
jgi:hypothetical protein